MADIARQAGVTRQTVYNAFDNKDAVLRGVVRLVTEQSLSAVTEQWRECSGFEEKLKHFHEFGPLKWYKMVQSSPEVAELMDGIHKVASEEMAQAAQLWRSALSKELDMIPGNPSQHSTDDLADFIYSMSLNAKYDASDVDDLDRRLRLFRQAVMALLTPK